MGKEESKYNIWIDSILYNSFTDNAILFENNEIEDVKFCLSNLDSFERNFPDIFENFLKLGFIKEMNFSEIDYLLFRNRFDTFNGKSYSITINPTLECNYKCWYCCVEEQKTIYKKCRMDDFVIEKVKKHIKYMIEVEKINELSIDWFGGEPLMYFYEVVEPISLYAYELCNKNNISFNNHVTTNAFYINSEMINGFNNINLNSYQIPIDGDERKHNKVKNNNSIGDYMKIIKTINDICENVKDARITMRINYDKQTLKTITNVIKDIKIENRSRIFVDFQRVWQIDLTRNELGNNILLLNTKKRFEEAGFKVTYFAYRRRDYKCCYADSFYHRVINYDGKVFKCAARDYDEELCIATINEDGSMAFNYNIISKMFDGSTFENETCLNCKKLPLCFGPCVQKYYETKIGKLTFKCLHDFSEISLKEYVIDKVNKNINYLLLK